MEAIGRRQLQACARRGPKRRVVPDGSVPTAGQYSLSAALAEARRATGLIVELQLNAGIYQVAAVEPELTHFDATFTCSELRKAAPLGMPQVAASGSN